ncbi:MAG: hypothetical protein R2758_15810 [Bacteroidales bacterium]
MADVNGKTMLEHITERVSRAGFNDIIVNIHHHPELMTEEIEKLRQKGYAITISDERDELLDTAGGCTGQRVSLTVSLSWSIMLMSLLILTWQPCTVSTAIRTPVATLAVRHGKGNRMLLVDQAGRLRGWRNNATREEILTVESNRKLEELAFMGIHIISPSIFELMEDGIYSLTSLYLMLAKKHTVRTFLHDEGYWFDCGTPQNLEKIRAHLGR